MKASQQEPEDHSKAKVDLLRKYIERYLSILSTSKYTGDIYVYDLFCGEGIYQNNFEGSPIVILKAIKDTYYMNKSKGNTTHKFHCLFNDKENQKTEKLKQEVAKKKLHYPEIGDLIFSNLEYHQILPKVLTQIDSLNRNDKAFVFIDPYGYKDIKAHQIKELLKKKNCEVLLFLPTQFMFRFDAKATPECLIDFITELVQANHWPISETGMKFIENLKEAFRTYLGDDYYTDSFIINRNSSQYFCLFFFTSHIYGFQKMLEAKWAIDEDEGRGW